MVELAGRVLVLHISERGGHAGGHKGGHAVQQDNK